MSAISAYVKGALLYMGLLQQLVLLGSAGGEAQAMQKFAASTASWLQNRYDYSTNYTVLRTQFVEQASYKQASDSAVPTNSRKESAPQKTHSDCWAVPDRLMFGMQSNAE